jgi:hypothetical protein
MTHIVLRKIMCEARTVGRVGKGVKCSVSGCGKEAVRSVSTGKAKSAGLNVSVNEKRVYLCKEHYKEFKKKTKKDKTIDKWRYGV